MAYRLGIDIGASISLAAYLLDDEVRLLPLGDGAAALPTIAHVRADGTVSAGDTAQGEASVQPDGLVEDPIARLGASSLLEVNGRKVTGEILVARLLEQILAAAVTRFAERPERTVISHPVGWRGTETAALMAAAGRAGLADVTLVAADESVAVARAIGGDDGDLEPAFLSAYGAAVMASKSLSDDLELTQPVPMPLVTREDLEGPLVEAAPKPSRTPSVYDPESPATVFSEADTAAVQPPPVPQAPRPLPSPPAVPQRRSRTAWYVTVALVMIAVLVVGAVLISRNDDGSGDQVVATSTVPAAVTSQPVATSSTILATTTIAPTTTTSTTSTTSSTTTTTSTTSTTIPELPGPGLLALSGLGVVLEPGTGEEANVPFGFSAEAALDRIVNVLGQPDIDSGWVFDEFCSAPEVRVVTIGDLELVFAGEQDDGSGSRSFEQWSVAGDDRRRPASLVTRLGAGIGSNVGDLQLIYGTALNVQLDPAVADGSGFFRLEDRGAIAGRTSGIEPDSVVTSISAGLTCQLGAVD